MIQINSIYHDIQLSFGTSDVKRTTIKQNSEDTHVLRIKLYDKQNNEITIDSNWNINISAIKGDKTHILNTNNISIKDNTIHVTMTKQMLSASGTERCELIIQDGDQTLFSDTFLIYVEPNVQDGSFIESSNECDSIIDTLQHVEEKKDMVDQLTSEIEETKVDIGKTYDELKIAVEETNDLIQENQIIKSNEAERQNNEGIRQSQEADRQTNTATAISNAEEATVNANNAAERANSATDDLQDKLASHHFVLTEDKDIAGGVPSLDVNAKIPISELYEATTSNKGVTQLTDSVTSTSITTAATPNSVKIVNDLLNSEINRAKSSESTLTTNLSDEVTRAKDAENTNANAISAETTRATTKENEIANNLSAHTSNTSNPHSVTKAQVGLGNVENKSSATIRGEITNSNVTTALGYTPLNQSLKGSASGLAELDSNGKVPSSQLPSFVDGVIEGYLSGGKFYKESAHTTEISGESGKIYIDLSTEKTYRWSGSAFVVISETLALGETSSTAYRGDRGKTAYDHSQSTHARTDATKVEASSTNGNIKINGTETTVYTHPSGTNPHGTTKSDVGLGNVDNVKQMPLSSWNWAPGSGQPSWLWGGNEMDKYYVFRPSELEVGSAKKDGNGNVIADTYLKGSSYSSITRFIHKLLAGKLLYVTSESSGDTIHCLGRGFKRTNSEKVIIGKCATGADESNTSSFYIIAKSEDAFAFTDYTEYASYLTKEVKTPAGNTVYVATMGSAWGTPNTTVDTVCGGTSYTISEFSMYSRGDGSNLDNTWILSVADAELFSNLKSFANIVEASLQYPLKIQNNCLIKKVSTDANYSFYLGCTESAPKLLMRSFTNVFQLFPDKNYSDSWQTHIGHSSYRFGAGFFTDVYNSSGVITTSDRNKKHDIKEISDEFSEKVVDGLIPSSFKFNDGSSGRTHFGIIAQDLEKLLESLGISNTDFAPLVKEYPDKEVEIENPDYDENDENSQKYIKKLEKDYDAEPIYNVRYEEFIMILVKYCQGLKKKDLELEQRMSELEEKVNKLIAG